MATKRKLTALAMAAVIAGLVVSGCTKKYYPANPDSVRHRGLIWSEYSAIQDYKIPSLRELESDYSAQ